MKMCRTMLVLAIFLIGCCVVMVTWMSPWLVVGAVVVLCVANAKKRGKRLTTLGSARWADGDDLRRAGMLDATNGLILGRTVDSPRKLLPAVKALCDKRVDDETACQDFLALFRKPEQVVVKLSNTVPHAAIFAPSGIGKGVSCATPFLLTCPESSVVVDYKGELTTLTAQHRREVFGHQVRVLDPYKVTTQAPDTFNPLDFIKKESPLAIDECLDLANALVTRTGQEKEPHWVDSAESWIAAMCAMVVQFAEPGDDRSLQAVRTLLSNPAKLQAAITLMQGSDAWDGMLARMGNQLTHFKDKELSSTLTTTNRFLRFLDTVAIAESTRMSSFDPAQLRNGKMTVYLVLPPNHARAQSPLLRMWISSMLRAVVAGGLQQ